MAPHLPGVNDQRDRKEPETTAAERARVLLTEAELAVLAAVEDLQLEKGYAPTLGQIAERIGWKSTGSVSQYLDRLRSHGVLEGRGRSLRVRR
jgi:SOS-response transcriptional repressor LexA